MISRIRIEAAQPFPVGNYVFGLSGIDGAPFKDHGGNQLATAGKFFSNGGGIGSAGVWDVNDAGFSSTTGIVTDDTTLDCELRYRLERYFRQHWPRNSESFQHQYRD